MAASATNIIIGSATISVGGSDMGYTKDGVTVRYAREYVRVMADQAVGVVKVGRASEEMHVETSLLEMSLSNLRKIWDLPAGHLVGSTLTLGYNNSCDVNEHQIILVGLSPDCNTRTFTLYKCISVGEGEYAMKRDEETAVAVDFECLKDSDNNDNFGTVVDS